MTNQIYIRLRDWFKRITRLNLPKLKLGDITNNITQGKFLNFQTLRSLR